MRLTIDMGAIAHALRRWWYRWCREPRPGTNCLDCGARLNAAERTYYGHTCERCEGIAFHKKDTANDVPEVTMTMLPTEKEALNVAYEEATRVLNGTGDPVQAQKTPAGERQ